MQRYKKHFVIVLKLILLILIIRYLIFVLFNQKSIQNFNELLLIIGKKGFDVRLVFILILSFLNHFFEAAKWKFALTDIQKISWIDSIHAVFSGIAIGSITPNNIGDYGGKILKLDSNNKAKGLLVNFVNSSAQLLSTLIFGAIALIFVIDNYYPNLPFLFIWKYIVIPAFIIVVVSLYFSIKHIAKLFQKYSIFKKIQSYVDVLALYQPMQLLWIFILSCLKYLMFTIQYILAIQYVLPDIHALHIASNTALLFFVQTIIPSFAVTELFVRGSIAAYFFSFISNDLLIIVLVTFSIWILNVILPAIIGAVLILKSKFY